MIESKAATGVRMTVESAEGFKTRLRHGPSGTEISTEAPRDNGGTGGSFSPTDLVGAALASCALTTMQLVASRDGMTWGAASARIGKRMTPPPRRIGEMLLEFTMPAGLSPEQRTRFEEVAHTCPVARSLNSELRVSMTFAYPD